jgi:hypothetical protein
MDMKTIRVKTDRYTIVGITNGYASYGRNAKGKYRLEVNLDLGVWGRNKIKLYQGDKKPFFKNLWLITLITIPFVPLTIILIPIIAFWDMYFEGAVNFVRDKAWQESVRAFNWINIVLIVVLVIWLLIK